MYVLFSCCVKTRCKMDFEKTITIIIIMMMNFESCKIIQIHKYNWHWDWFMQHRVDVHYKENMQVHTSSLMRRRNKLVSQLAMIRNSSVFLFLVCLTEQLQDSKKTHCWVEKLHVGTLQTQLISCQTSINLKRNQKMLSVCKSPLRWNDISSMSSFWF